jgi:hypothetical protein
MKVFTIFFSSFFLASVAAVNHTTRAEQLGLNNTWVAPMPPDQIDAEATDQFLINNWYTANKNIYGGSGISFVNNPTTINDTTAANNDSAVLRVAYPVGSYAPVGTKSESGKVGGVEFVSDPNNGVFYDEALLTYDLLFDQNFDWVKGGKLPGIYGGMMML